LVIATIKPTLVYLVVPAMVFWALFSGRRRFVLGFASALGVCLLSSTLLLPSWITDWIGRVSSYRSYTVGQSPVWLLAHNYIPTLGRTGEWALSLGLLAVLIAVWWRTLRASHSAGEFLWALSVTLVISNLVVPRSATTNYVLLLLPILWLVAALDRSGRKGKVIAGLVLIVLFVGQWWLHLATVVGTQEQPVVFLPLPILVGIALWMGRDRLLHDAELARMTL
jgi:hypothetical protein